MICSNCGYQCEKGKYCTKCGGQLVPEQEMGDFTENKITVGTKEGQPENKESRQENEKRSKKEEKRSGEEIRQRKESKSEGEGGKKKESKSEEEGGKEKESRSEGEGEKKKESRKEKGSKEEKESGQRGRNQKKDKMPMDEEEGQEGAKKKKWNKNWMIAAVAAAVLIVFLVAKWTSGGSNIFDAYEPDALSIHSFEAADGSEKWISVLVGAESVLELPDTKNYIAAGLSMNGAAGYLIDRNSALYFIDKNGYQKVEDNIAFAMISDQGKGIVYSARAESENEGLYLYDAGEKKSEPIASEAYLHAGDFVISPDGKTVAYRDDAGCHRYVNGKEHGNAIKEAYPLAISDGGKYFYYKKEDYIYAVKNDSDPERLGVWEEACYYWNRDYSQMLYGSEHKTYLYDQGEKTTLASEQMGVLEIPRTAPVIKRLAGDGKDGVVICAVGASDFRGMVCGVGEGLYYITKKLEFEKISSGYQDALLSEDGNALLYSKSGELYRVRKLSASLEPVQVGHDLQVNEQAGKGIFTSNADLSEIYYFNKDMELMYLAGKETKVIYDDSFASHMFLAEGSRLYFIGDYYRGKGTLFVSESGGRPQKVSSSEQVSRLYMHNGTIYYSTAEDGALFSVKKGKEHKIEAFEIKKGEVR